MQIEMRPTSDLKPYPNNPRLNDAAVDAVARSLKHLCGARERRRDVIGQTMMCAYNTYNINNNITVHDKCSGIIRTVREARIVGSF